MKWFAKIIRREDGGAAASFVGVYVHFHPAAPTELCTDGGEACFEATD
jgi:hypothetical protein